MKYITVQFSIHFTKPVEADTEPLFIIRSMIGKNLRSISCISRKSTCPECLYNKTCAYSFLFESIIETSNDTLPGRNRASHPYSLSGDLLRNKKEICDYSFKITLFEKAIDFLPYIYAALVRSGKDGLFKSRVTFEVKSVIVGNKNILIEENQLNLNFDVNNFNFCDDEKACNANNDKSLCEKEVLIELKSPLRFKVQGKYTSNFTASDFFNCLFRRAKTLFMMYENEGEKNNNVFEKYKPSPSLEITQKNLTWKDINHYSARQKNAMELGGVIGTFKIKGEFSKFDLDLLEFNKIANAGKNTNFGLGQIDYWLR